MDNLQQHGDAQWQAAGGGYTLRAHSTPEPDMPSRPEHDPVRPPAPDDEPQDEPMPIKEPVPHQTPIKAVPCYA